LSQRKYLIDLLIETGALRSSPIDTPMNNVSVRSELGWWSWWSWSLPWAAYILAYYQTLLLSQYMRTPYQVHWNAASRVLRYLKGAPGKGLFYWPHISITRYSDADWTVTTLIRVLSVATVHLLGLILSLGIVRSKNLLLDLVLRLSTGLSHILPVRWYEFKSLLCEMGVVSPYYMIMCCDNQAAMYISNNPMFHEKTKHIKVDCYFIQDMVMTKQIITSYVTSGEQLGDIIIKALFRKHFSTLCNKLGIIDIYAPTWRGVLEYVKVFLYFSYLFLIYIKTRQPQSRVYVAYFQLSHLQKWHYRRIKFTSTIKGIDITKNGNKKIKIWARFYNAKQWSSFL